MSNRKSIVNETRVYNAVMTRSLGSPEMSLRDAEPNETEPPWFTVKDLTAKLATTERQIRRWIAAGDLSVTRLGPKSIRIRPADLASFLGRRSQGRRSPRGRRSP